MTTDGLPRSEAQPKPEPAPKSSIVCEFCECTLAPSGDFISLSARAKGLRDLEDSLDTANANLAKSQTDLAEALRERDEARAEVTRLSTPAEDNGENARGQKLHLTW